MAMKIISLKMDILLSFVISIPENNEINEKPKTAILGTRFSISNKLTGTLDKSKTFNYFINLFCSLFLLLP